jgi:hypothetical protein
MRPLRCTIMASLAFVAITGGLASADDASLYKIIVKDRTVYGTPVDDKHFRMCSTGVVIERPESARVEPASGACPPRGIGPFVPHAGHGKLKLKLSKPKASPPS